MAISITPYLKQSCYKVTKANHILYSGLSAATLTLTGTLPTVGFRTAVTLSSTTGHTDCAGTVVVGGETLTFTAAGKKLTTTNLSALPVITTANLDCTVLIEAITTGGAPIIKETQTAIYCRLQNTQKSFLNPSGEWAQSAAIAYTNDSALVIGAELLVGSTYYNIAQVSAHVNKAGTEIFRKLYLV